MRQYVDAKEFKLVSTTYTIQMASKISGVGVHTIRAWEKRYKALVPSRDASGHRTYTKSDVEKLMLLSELCLLGYTISKVAAYSIDELKSQLKTLGKTEESFESQDFNLIADHSKSILDPSQSMPILQFALRSFNLAVINVELAKLKASVSARDFALTVMTPLIQTLFEQSASGAFSAPQVQGIKALFKFHMGHYLYHPVERIDKSKLNAVICGAEGDSDDLSLGSIGLLCGHHGIHYTYLGADFFIDALTDAVKSYEVNLVVIGLSSNLAAMSKSHFQNYLEKALARFPNQTEILVVGKIAFDWDKSKDKRLTFLKNLDAVDSFFEQKNS